MLYNREQSFLSILSLLTGLFSAIVTLTIWLTFSMNIEMIVFFRFAVIAILLLPFLKDHRKKKSSSSNHFLYLFTAFANLGVAYCLITALNQAPAFSVLSLFFSTPIYVALVTRIWVGKRIVKKQIPGILIGFLSIIIAIFFTPFNHFDVVAIISLTAGVLQAIAWVGWQRLSYSEPLYKIYFYLWILPALIALLPLTYAWQMPSLSQSILITIIALLMLLFQWMLKRTSSYIHFYNYGFMFYTVIFVTAFLDLIIWKRYPSWTAFGASSLVLLSSIIMIRSDPKLAAFLTDSSSMKFHLKKYKKPVS